MGSSVISAGLLEDHLRCVSKSWLRLQDRPGQITDYLAFRTQADARYRERASEAIAARYTATDVLRAGGSPWLDLGADWALVLDAIARAEDLETRFDGLQRVPGDSQLGVFHYRPVRFCARARPDPVVPLLLAFDAMVLGRVQGRTPEDGVLVCGPTFGQTRVRLRSHLDALAPVLTRLRLQTTAAGEPPLLLNRHCDRCEFKGFCRAKAVEADNLTLLRGMTPKEVARHNAKGIFTVRQLSYTFRPRRPAKRQERQFLHSFALQALALRENKVHVHGDPKVTLPPTQVYVDIEGLPDRGFYYLIGVLVVTGASCEYRYFWAGDEARQETIFTEFAEFVGRQADCGLFHYGSYEANALRRMIPRVPEVSRGPLAAVLAAATNILSVVGPHVYFPTTANSLKELAGFLGFCWTDAGASGLQSILWREVWEAARDEATKERLLRYNREDCLALRRVTEFIAAITAPRVQEEPGPPRPEGVIYTAELQPASLPKQKFGKADFCLADLEFVNRCAYFDYQRDRVYLRPDQGSGVAHARRHRKRRRRTKVNKRVEVRCKRCPHCGSKRLAQGQPLSMRIVDVKFLVGGGVKKWVIAYSSWHYHCDKCGQTFRPPGYPQAAARHGDGLVNWTVYENVALGQNMLKLQRCLRDVFKLDVPQCTLYRFKALVAKRYEPTHEAILAELLRGPSLNVDETEARLWKEKGHVWVFAGAHGAYYEYRDSRNGQFLGERLEGFSGVLVSDFFTAYDAPGCPQQKCLIHLIRDMNEDLKANAFDGELKEIVQGFATVVRPMIQTVDRHGLARSRLQKHKSAAMGFVERVVAQRTSSEAAAKYQKRIEKYGHRLFTFLDYDGVPWNNNNAEHAIKSFARYRRFADGRFTKKSITDYLAILSVFQTCEYRSVNVLEFLLSGKTDIGSPDATRSPAGEPGLVLVRPSAGVPGNTAAVPPMPK